jgi:hypothetical protein
MNFKEYSDRELISEGGISGHLSHPFDVEDFTFEDIQEIIDNSLSGKLDRANEKLDGSNISVSIRDGQLVIGRNPTHIKNGGKLAPTLEQFKKEYPDRQSWIKSAEDLENSFKSLTPKEKQKFFANGKKWLTMEVLHSDFENVIPYKVQQLVFHGTRVAKEDGSTELENKQDAIDLEAALAKKGALSGKTFKISGPKYLQLKEVPDFANQKKKFSDKLSSIKKELGAKDSDTLKDVFTKVYQKAMDEKKLNKLSPEIQDTLIRRWRDGDKSTSLTALRKMVDEKQFEAIKDIDERAGQLHKQATIPLEKLFIGVGATVLENIGDLIGMSGDVAAKKKDMVARINAVVDDAKKSNNPKVMAKIQLELDRIQEAGGLEKIIPSEGIVFYHKGHLLKLTGAFAPANQLYGLRFKDLSNKPETAEKVVVHSTPETMKKIPDEKKQRAKRLAKNLKIISDKPANDYYTNLSKKASEKAKELNTIDKEKSRFYSSWSKYWAGMAIGKEVSMPKGPAPKIRGKK